MKDTLKIFGFIAFMICAVVGLLFAYEPDQRRAEEKEIGFSDASFESLKLHRIAILSPALHEPLSAETCNIVASHFSEGNQESLDGGLYGENSFFESMMIATQIENNWQLCLGNVP